MATQAGRQSGQWAVVGRTVDEEEEGIQGLHSKRH